MELLVCLADHAGEALSKEKLVQTVWPDSFVSDDALKRCIFELRRVFDDDAREPHIIETIPKRGYRLIATINRASVDIPAAASPSVTHDSIAVLPFINISADAENEFFADGITEEIINALSQIEHLQVAARTSSFFFKGKHVDMRLIGEQLNVRTVLEGSVRKHENHLRITVQLVTVEDGYHLWSERYDRELKDIFEIQDEIARSIASRLRLTLESKQHDPLVKAATKNLEAYSLYIKGRALLPRRGPAAAYLDCFARAVDLDPDYAQAWAGLADSYTVLGYSGLVPPEASMPKSLEAARRAVALDPLLAEAHNALAMASLMGAWDKPAAEREFLRALALNPRYIQARTWYAMYYLMFSEGRIAEAVGEAKLAMESDALSSYAHTMYGFVCGYAGEFTQAIRACRRAVELDSESYLARFALQEVLRVSGQFDESIAVGELALSISGRHSWAMTFLALAFADCGRTADADAVYTEMLARARRQYIAPAPLAAVASAAAREEDAIGHARDAFNRRDPGCLFIFSPYTCIADRLYAYSRFRELRNEMGFQ
jgi:adenylate cyclase